MSSRRSAQRRRGGGRDQHADPVSVSPDALLDSEDLEAQLSRRLQAQGKTSPVPAAGGEGGDAAEADADAAAVAKTAGTKTAKVAGITPAALTAALASEAQEAAKYTQEAEAVFARGGDAAVQEALRAEIAKSKKLESELAQLKKRVDAAKRQQDAKSVELGKLAQQKDSIHNACRVLLAERERLERVLAEQSATDEKLRDDVRTKFETDVEGILKKVEEQSEQKATTLAENEELSKKFDELKATFDEMMSGKMSQWKERDEETRSVVTELQERMIEHDKLTQLVEAREAEATNLQRGAEAYLEQATMYEERMGDFESALIKSAEVVKLTAQREEETHAEIKRLEAARGDDLAARKAAEADVQKVKQRVRDVRKQVQQLERTKATAEKKCRSAQEAIRKRDAGKK